MQDGGPDFRPIIMRTDLITTAYSLGEPASRIDPDLLYWQWLALVLLVAAVLWTVALAVWMFRPGDRELEVEPRYRRTSS